MNNETSYRIAFDTPFQPFGFMRDGRPAGMLIELVGAGLERAKLPYEWAPMSLEACEPALYSGEVDALAFKGVIPERFDKMDFSEPLLISGAALFRRPGAPDSDDPRAFAGLRVVTTRKGPFAGQLARDYPELQLVLVDSQEASFETLVAGGAEAAAQNFHSGRQMANELHPGKLLMPRSPYSRLTVSMAVAKGKSQDLLQRFDRALDAMQQDGSATRIIERWLPA
jgi:ABC-type amino acid transport substrate-binding protein